MANARKQVKKQSNAGRAGKAGKEAQLVLCFVMVLNFAHVIEVCGKLGLLSWYFVVLKLNVLSLT